MCAYGSLDCLVTSSLDIDDDELIGAADASLLTDLCAEAPARIARRKGEGAKPKTKRRAPPRDSGDGSGSGSKRRRAESSLAALHESFDDEAADDGGLGSSGKSGARASVRQSDESRARRQRQWAQEPACVPHSATAQRLLRQLADFNPSGQGDLAPNVLLPSQRRERAREEEAEASALAPGSVSLDSVDWEWPALQAEGLQAEGLQADELQAERVQSEGQDALLELLGDAEQRDAFHAAPASEHAGDGADGDGDGGADSHGGADGRCGSPRAFHGLRGASHEAAARFESVGLGLGHASVSLPMRRNISVRSHVFLGVCEGV
eukprot:2696065-Pleurochrysis_carterae.AAC.1